MTEHKMAELMSVLEQLRAYPSLKPMLTTMQLVISWLLLSQRRVIAQLRRYWHLPSFSIYFHKGLGSWSRAALFYQKAYLFSTSLPPLHFISNWNHCNYFLSFFFLVIYSFLRVFKTPRGYCFPGEQKQRSDTKYETGNRCKRVYYMTWGDSTCLLV